jgi:hypothetical protein
MEKDNGCASLWWGEAPEPPDTVARAFLLIYNFPGEA